LSDDISVPAGESGIRYAGKQGVSAIAEMASQARDAATTASDSIVAYTKENPMKALAMAAASGALLYMAMKALSPLRD
jgi:hypothetical protein